MLEPGQVTDLAIRSTSPLSNSENEYTLENSKAFRYVYVTHEPGVQIGEVSMQYEYLPEEYRGNFRCNDEELNRIWEVGAYTMHLTTREFFIDGIIRDLKDYGVEMPEFKVEEGKLCGCVKTKMTVLNSYRL